VQSFASGMDPTMWQQIHGVVSKVHTVLSTKEEFIANLPVVQSMKASVSFQAAVPRVAELLKTITASTQLDALKSFDGQLFFTGPASSLLSQAEAISKLMPEGVFVTSLKGVTIEPVSTEGDTAVLKITSPSPNGEPDVQEVEFVRVDGHWVPAEMANDWDANMAMTREQIKAMPEMLQQSGQQVAMFSGMITASLDPLAAAEDQEQFNMAVEQLQAGLGGLIGPMLGGLSFGEGPEEEFGDVSSQLDASDGEIDLSEENETPVEEEETPTEEEPAATE